MNVSAYWPWWAGALMLAGSAVTYRWITGFPLGVSGTLTRILHWRENEALRESEIFLGELATNPAALEAELMRATEAQFGSTKSHADAGVPEQSTALTPTESEPEPKPELALAEGSMCTPPPATDIPAVRPSAFQNLLLLVMIAVGGAISALLSGRWALTTDMGPTFGHVLTSGWTQIPILVAGGIFVGAGTRMSGGCSSGHGLSGCSRFHGNSLLATAAFFGAGICMSLLLRAVAS